MYKLEAQEEESIWISRHLLAIRQQKDEIKPDLVLLYSPHCCLSLYLHNNVVAVALWQQQQQLNRRHGLHLSKARVRTLVVVFG